MSEEKKVESVDEDVEEKEEEESETEGTEGKEDFSKEEFVAANKYNQSLRKQREMEAENRELQKKLAEADESNTEEKEEEDDDDSFFNEEDKKEKVDEASIIDEKLKPVLAQLDKSAKDQHRRERDQFFDAHPEYAEDGKKFQTLLDEVDNFNPNSTDSHFVQMEKAHRIIAGDYMGSSEVDDKKAEMASDTASGEDESQKGAPKEEFTTEERANMKEWGISEEGMKAYKEKTESGSMQIL